MPKELDIEVDEHDNYIGLRQKEDFYDGKYIHRSSHLLLFSSQNQVLLQKRAKDKKWYPDLYTYSVSGTVANETYEECIKKETEEEIGISPAFRKLFKYPHFDEIDKAFHMVFIGRYDKPIKPDKREIQEIKWISLEDLKQDLEINPQIYTPVFRKGMNIFFEGYADKIDFD